MTLRLWQEQSVYPNKRIIKINNQSFQKGHVPRKPGLRQNLCAQLSLGWLFFPVCRVINPTCVTSPLSAVLPTAELENIFLGAAGVGSGATCCPPGMSEKPHGTLLLSLLLPFPDHSKDLPVGCDQQNEPPGFLLAGDWRNPPSVRLLRMKWILRRQKMLIIKKVLDIEKLRTV